MSLNTITRRSVTFARLNFVLEQGRIAYERDTKYMKVGNGVNRYNELPYVTAPDSGGGGGGAVSTSFVDGGTFTTNLTEAPRFQVDFGAFT